MTAAHHDRQNLPAARRRLDLAVAALIEPKPHTVRRDDGTTEIVWLDPVMDQLFDAVGGQSGERAGGRSTTPVWADILDTIQKIERQIGRWHPDIPDGYNPATPLLIARLEALRDRTWTVEDANHVNVIARQLEVFTASIREKLNPEPVIYLMAADRPGAAACTACGTRYVYRPDPSDNNRPKRQPALKVTGHGCKCQHCHASWDSGQLRLLAGALGYPLPKGVLE